MPESTIIYTQTDEAPALATYSLLPIIEAFTSVADVAVERRDISLAGRLLAAFSDYLPAEHRVSDDLQELGEMVKLANANIIKLPNISATMSQLKLAVAELQSQGFDLPDVPDAPSTDVERDVLARYKKVSGSAVNPVLRQGNSDRRAPLSVKNFARSHPHSMGRWSPDSATAVAHMNGGDFFSNEQSAVMREDGKLSVVLVDANGASEPLRAPITVLAGEIIDASVLQLAHLTPFLAAQVARARAENLLFSFHVKATMMKVSDPILFGHTVRAFFPETFKQHDDFFRRHDMNPNEGIALMLSRLSELDGGEQIAASFAAEMSNGPRLAMVDSARGITNLHSPNDVIVDASLAAMIRSSGHMWGPDGEEGDTLAVVPDASYATMYQVVIDDCKSHGAFDPATLGAVSNVGLMAQAAEEYGSHDKTFEIPHDGRVLVSDENGNIVFEVVVAQGDIFRMCQTKDLPVRNWVQLAIARGRATGDPAIFWLNEHRPHDVHLIAKVTAYLQEYGAEGLDMQIMAPDDAMSHTLARSRSGLNTISVTGNVLRDYLTDLFPIMELGTSSKMLSVVTLLSGGGLFETGAAGSAPKHVQQLEAENYLRWDSLGEFLALAVSLETYAQFTGNAQAQVLASALDRATGRFLEEDRSPGRSLGTIDSRGSHFYLALYWAQELALQEDDAELAKIFSPMAQELQDKEQVIVDELAAVQGHRTSVGGYFHPDPTMAASVMRPSTTLNTILASLG